MSNKKRLKANLNKPLRGKHFLAIQTSNILSIPMIFLTTLTFLAFPSFINSELTADHVVLAINCGGEKIKDSKDITYLEDSYVSGGQSSDFGSQFEIKNTPDQALYQTERWSESDFTYSLPITDEGKFVLVLKFSEVYFNSVNEKIFDVALGSKVVIKHLDVFAKVGKSTAFDEFVEFELRANKVLVAGKVVDGAYDAKEKTLQLIFKKGEKDNPKINAILVVKGGLVNTDFEGFKLQLEELEREKMEKERKQREIKKRNNLHYDFEDFEDDFVDTDVEKATSVVGSPLFIVSVLLISWVGYQFFYKKGVVEEKDD